MEVEPPKLADDGPLAPPAPEEARCAAASHAVRPTVNARASQAARSASGDAAPTPKAAMIERIKQRRAQHHAAPGAERPPFRPHQVCHLRARREQPAAGGRAGPAGGSALRRRAGCGVTALRRARRASTCAT
jgi:hypothetical protein